jgi:hypothetical protein
VSKAERATLRSAILDRLREARTDRFGQNLMSFSAWGATRELLRRGRVDYAAVTTIDGGVRVLATVEMSRGLAMQISTGTAADVLETMLSNRDVELGSGWQALRPSPMTLAQEDLDDDLAYDPDQIGRPNSRGDRRRADDRFAGVEWLDG